MAIETYNAGTPTRQGFYKVKAKDGSTHIAEWREYDKKDGKRWWTYRSDDRTVAKTRVALAEVVNHTKGNAVVTVVVGYTKVSDADVQDFMKRSLTREELIQDSLETFLANESTTQLYFREIPPSRRLAVGQSVKMGHLRDAKVAHLHNDGQAVTIEYRNVQKKGGEEVEMGTAFLTRFWLDFLPVTEPTALHLSSMPLFTSQGHFNTPLAQLLHRMYRDGGVSDSPDYQRKYVWEQSDKDRFLDSLFCGRPLGTFLFVTEKHPKQDILLDGKQRINTLMELISSTLPYKGVYWHEMSFGDRSAAMTRSVQFADLSVKQYSRSQLLEIFLEVNAAGVPQTEEHLASVRTKLVEALAAEAAVTLKVL